MRFSSHLVETNTNPDLKWALDTITSSSFGWTLSGSCLTYMHLFSWFLKGDLLQNQKIRISICATAFLWMNALFHSWNWQPVWDKYFQKLYVCYLICPMLALMLCCFSYQLTSHFQCFYSSQEGVIGTRDSSHMKTKKWTEYIKQWFSIYWRSANKWQWSQGDKRVIKWGSWLLQFTALREFPGHCTRVGTQMKSIGPSELNR